jgi:excisionase family DNA binding protein
MTSASNCNLFLEKVRSIQKALSAERNGFMLQIMSDDRLLTIKELAERLQYSADWVRTQVRAGRLPEIRFNRRAWRFHWPTVLAALQQMQ